MLSFLVNIVLKSNLISKKILKDIKLINILKYFIISILLFGLISYAVMPIESYFLNTSTSFIMTIIKLGIVFVVVGLVTSVILYLLSDSTKNLFRRMINLIKRKFKK